MMANQPLSIEHNLDRLISMRDSDDLEQRTQYNNLLRAQPSIRVSIGYYEAAQTRNTQP